MYRALSSWGAAVSWSNLPSYALTCGIAWLVIAWPSTSEAVPFEVRITELTQCRTGVDPGLQGPIGEFYARVTVDGEVQANADDRYDFGFAGAVFPLVLTDKTWVFEFDAPLDDLTVDLKIEILDFDDFGQPDIMDISATQGTVSLEQEFNLQTGEVTGNEPWTDCSQTDLGNQVIVVYELIAPDFSQLDADGDGLPNEWETNGVDTDNDGNIDVPLPAMGASPDHKDIFVELDWMEGEEPNQKAVRGVKQVFARAPVSVGGVPNPDGEPGINVWIDTGNLRDPAGNEGGAGWGTCGDGQDNDGDGQTDTDDTDCLVGDNFFGGNEVPASTICSLANDPQDTDFHDVKAQNFDSDNRLPIFHYALSARGCDEDDDGELDSAGKGERGGDDFIDFSHDAGTLAHELGHNLNLAHGGGEDHNCKPNYLSVMNYYYSDGMPQYGGRTRVDFSPPQIGLGGDRGTAPLPPLNEDSLDESIVLDPEDFQNHMYFINGEGQVTQTPVDGDVGHNGTIEGVDWDGDGSYDGSDLDVNIDTVTEDGFPPACRNDDLTDALTGYDDWANMELAFQQFGQSASGPINAVDEDLPTQQERRAFERAANTTDLRISKTAAPDPASFPNPVTYTIEVSNLGPNPANRVVVEERLDPNLTYVSDTAACDVDGTHRLVCELGVLSATHSVSFEVVADTANACVGGQPVSPTNQAEVENAYEPSGADPNPGDNSISLTHAIVDDTPPELDVSVSPTTIWPPLGRLVTVDATITVSDECDSTPSVRLVDITSDESTAGNAPAGRTGDDIQGAEFGTDDRSFLLRAERDGSGSGRTYTVVYEATDASGNSTTTEAEVFVSHDQRP